MKKFKCILSMILCLTMLISTMPMAVFAVSNEDDFSYSVLTDGSIKITDYNGSDTKIIIPDTIDGKKVSAIGNYAFFVSQNSSGSTIISIEVPEGVTSLGNYAFANCSTLDTIILPMSLKSIGGSCFSGVSGLSIKFCGSQERWINIEKGSYWFGGSNYSYVYEYQRSAINLPEDCIASALSIGDTFNMGTYPQTKVSDNELIQKLNSYSLTMHSYEYEYLDSDDNAQTLDMSYGDVYYSGHRYRKVVFYQYRPRYPFYEPTEEYSSQDDNGYYVGEAYWFVWEPITWQVLDIKSDGVYAISKQILDAMAYNTIDSDDSVYWRDSSLNKWLNNDFFSFAFSDDDKNNINDKIGILLRLVSASNRNYYTENFNNLKDRSALKTDYANCQGGSNYYWLYDSGTMHNSFGSVAPDGSVGTSYCDRTNIGVRPVIAIDPLAKIPETNLPNIEDDKIIKPNIKFGKDRFSFNENILGHIGDTVNSLLVYTSQTENTTALDIVSSDTSIVEIGTINHGVGEYILSENEHVATVPLKLKSEGTVTITITSPEGISESVDVIVESFSHSLSDFNTSKYVADRWLDENDVHYPTIQNYMDNFKDPSYETIKILQSDKDFVSSLAAWETAKIINDPSYVADQKISKKQYYESILFSLLSTQFEESTLLDYINNTKIAETEKFLKSTTKFINSIDSLDATHILQTEKLTESEKSLLKNDLKTSASSQMLEGFKSIDIVVDILDYANDINDFVDVCGKYLTLLEVQKSIEQVFDTMYAKCDYNILSDSDKLCLKAALNDVSDACNSQIDVMLAQIRSGTTLIRQWSTDLLVGEMWSAIIKSNPYVACVKAGLSVGIGISNIAFSTDKIKAQYYSMCCLNDVRLLINQTVDELGAKYKASNSTEDAEAYIAAVGFIFDSYILGCNYALDFQKLIHEETLANKAKDYLEAKLLFKNDDSYTKFKETAESLMKNVELDYTLLQKQWCYNLLDDYPELFEVMAKEIDLQFYSNLEHSSIRVDGISCEYTGKACTPDVTVVMNGKKLILNQDYTVSYSNNINPGVAKVTVTGIGEYHGTNSSTFNINESWFNTKIDIRNNGPVRTMRSLRTRSVSTVNTDNAPINIYVYRNNSLVATIENGEVMNSSIHVVVWGDRVSLLLPDSEYEIVVESEQNTSIDYSYSEYHELLVTKTKNYNDTIITPSNSLSHLINTENVLLGTETLISDFDSQSNTGEVHNILVDGGAASSNTALNNEWISISAIMPEGYRFVEWQTNSNITFLDKTSSTTSFIMCNEDVEIVAVFEKFVLGDITGDDKVNIKDWNRLYDHINEVDLLSDDELLRADVTGDGKVNIKDWNRIYDHITEINPLY